MTQQEILDMVLFYVERDQLNQKGRQQEKIYKKCFLMNKLREHKYTLYFIGDVFNQHHASIIHNIKTHKDLKKWNTEHYETIVGELMEAFENTDYIEPTRILVDDILECQNVYQLNRVKRWITENKYKTDTDIELI
jgi:hypothetical protein